MARHGQNAGGMWDAQKAVATYWIKPDKETPLWRSDSQVFYPTLSTPVFQIVSPISPAVFREEAVRSAGRRDGQRSRGDGAVLGLAWNSVRFGDACELNLTHFRQCISGASRSECDGELSLLLALHGLTMK